MHHRMTNTTHSDTRWLRAFWILLAVLLVARIVYAATVPMPLSPDEAYYWDWSRQLDYGYYSKPPLIAWIIAAATALGGTSELAIRMPAVLFGTALLVPIFFLGRSIAGAKTGFFAAVLMAATPAQVAMSVLMTIDAPMLCCWSFALWSFWELNERAKSGRPIALWLTMAILSVGIGLLAKQTMIGFVALAGFFLLISHQDRRGLLQGWSWTFAILSLLFLAPVVYWNSQHGWITVQHTSEHFGAKTFDLTKRVVMALESYGSQAGVVSPITWIMVLASLAVSTWNWRRLSSAGKYLWAFSAPPLAAVFVLCVMQRVQPNWPAPFYIAGLVMAAVWLVRPSALLVSAAPIATTSEEPIAAPRRLGWSLACGVACALLVAAAPYILVAAGLQGTKLDPTARLNGWRELAQQLDEIRAQIPDGKELVLVSATSRPAVSAFAYYLSDHPRVYRWNPTTIDSQHDLWGGPRDASGRDLLVIVQDGPGAPPPLAAAGRTSEPLGQIQVEIGNGRQRIYHLWRINDLTDWPDTRLMTASRGHSPQH